MRKTILSAVIAAGAVLSMPAASLSPEAALEAALKVNGTSRASATDATAYSLEWTGEGKGVYVFAREKGGFVIAAGDDTAPALLGFSDSGTFDPSSMPDALKAMLMQMDDAVSSGRVTVTAATPRADIAPLITSQWNQDAPYNLLTPELNDTHTLTGCVATAVAQLVNFWKYPQAGTGEISYRWQQGSKTLTYDFAAHPFDFAHITDTYGEASTEEERDAVAQLMLAAGMASQMEYSLTFSSATDINAALGLINYLGYDAGMKLLYRDFYRINEWNSMVYTELEERRPVLYYGFSPLGGHAFVCDGYMNTSGEDYFHINWGWGGLSDGYFLLSILNPEYLGLGGSAGGFNIMQSALMGVKPAGAEPSALYRQVLWFGYFGVGAFEYTRGSRMLFGSAGGLMRAGLYNMSLEPVDINLGIQLTPEAGGAPRYFASDTPYPLASSAGIEYFQVPSDTLPEGTYVVRPSFRYIGSEEWQVIPEETRMRTRIVMTVTGNRITFDVTDNSDGIILNEVAVERPVVVNGQPFRISAEAFAYNTDEAVKITPVLTNSGGRVLSRNSTWELHPTAGETYNHSWDTPFATEIKPGAYQLIMIDDRMTMLCDPITVAVVNADTKTEFSIGNFRINRKTPGTAPSTITGSQFALTYRIGLLTGYFEGNVSPWLFDSEGNPIRALNSGEDLTLFPSESRTVDYTIEIPDLDHKLVYGVGVRSTASATDEPVTISKIYLFNFSDAGIDDVISDRPDAPCKYYDTSGVSLTSPRKGRVTVVRSQGRAAKVIVD